MGKCKNCSRELGTFELVCSNCGTGCNYDPEHPEQFGCAVVLVVIVILSVIASLFIF